MTTTMMRGKYHKDLALFQMTFCLIDSSGCFCQINVIYCLLGHGLIMSIFQAFKIF